MNNKLKTTIALLLVCVGALAMTVSAVAATALVSRVEIDALYFLPFLTQFSVLALAFAFVVGCFVAVASSYVVRKRLGIETIRELFQKP